MSRGLGDVYKRQKKYKLSKLENRYQNASLPNYEIIDLNNTKMEKQSWISNEIIEKVNVHLKKKGSNFIFLK